MNQHSLNDLIIIAISGVNFLVSKIVDFHLSDVISIVIGILSIIYIAMGILLRIKKLKNN